MDDNSSQHQQLLPPPPPPPPLPQQHQEQTLQPLIPTSPQKKEQPPLSQEQSSPPLQSPLKQNQLPSPQHETPSTPPSHQQNSHDGYCGKQMMIVDVATANDLGKNKECEQTLVKDTKTPYVMFDMMTATNAAAQKLLDQLEIDKSVNIQPDVVDCGSPSHRESPVEVSTQ